MEACGLPVLEPRSPESAPAGGNRGARGPHALRGSREGPLQPLSPLGVAGGLWPEVTLLCLCLCGHRASPLLSNLPVPPSCKDPTLHLGPPKGES